MTTKTTLNLTLPPPPPPPATVDAARAEVEKLYEREQRAAERVLGIRREEADAAMSAGLLDLDTITFEDASAVKLADHLGRLHGQQVLAQRVIAAARARRREAIQALYTAEAATLREQASVAQREAERHAEQVAAVLSQIEQLEGVRYTPEGPPDLGIGAYADPRPGGWPMPRSMDLQLRAQAFEQQALAMERRAVQDHGAIDASSHEDTLAQLAAFGPLAIAPDVVAVTDWLTTAIAAVEEQRARREWLRGAPLTIVLRWRDGAIDRGASRVALVDLDV
jgi:hypothetical protein